MTDGTATFELERFAWSDGAFELQGCWRADEPTRLGRARLVVEVEGRRRRIGAQGGKGASAGPDGEPWSVRFGCAQRPASVGPAELEVGADLAIDLPAPILGDAPALQDVAAADAALERLAAARAAADQATQRLEDERAETEQTAARVAAETAEAAIGRAEAAARDAGEAAAGAIVGQAVEAAEVAAAQIAQEAVERAETLSADAAREAVASAERIAAETAERSAREIAVRAARDVAERAATETVQRVAERAVREALAAATPPPQTAAGEDAPAADNGSQPVPTDVDAIDRAVAAALQRAEADLQAKARETAERIVRERLSAVETVEATSGVSRPHADTEATTSQAPPTTPQERVRPTEPLPPRSSAPPSARRTAIRHSLERPREPKSILLSERTPSAASRYVAYGLAGVIVILIVLVLVLLL